jgi:hypothetical protein
MDPTSVLAEKLARRLEEEWTSRKGGRIPPLESYIDWLPEERREPVLRRLIPIDAAFRRLAGEPSSLEDFLLRFPAHHELIRSLFGPEGKLIRSVEHDPAAPPDASGSPVPQADDDVIPLAETDEAPPRPIRARQVEGPLPARASVGAPRPALPRRKVISSFTPVDWDDHADDPPIWWKYLRIQLWLTAGCVAMLGVHLVAQMLFFQELGRQLAGPRQVPYDVYSSESTRAWANRRDQTLIDRQLWFQGSANVLMGLVGLTVLGYLGLGGYAGLLAVRGAVSRGAAVETENDDAGDEPAPWWKAPLTIRPPARLRPLALVVAGFMGVLLLELGIMALGRAGGIVLIFGLANLVYLGTLLLSALYWLAMTVPLMLGSATLTAPAERRWLMGLLAAIGGAIGLGPILPVFVLAA